jgi:hypothetical protein
LAIKKRAAKTSQQLSDVWTIQSIIWAVELTGLTYGTLPWTWRFETPDFKPLGLHSQAVWLPQVFNLLTSKFWAPATVWLVTSLVLPSIFAYFFNLTYTNPKPKTKRVKPLREYDPLTFSIIKGLASWLVYSQGFRFWGAVDDSTIAVVNESVFGGYNGILIGAAIGVLTSIHDHLSFKA